MFYYVEVNRTERKNMTLEQFILDYAKKHNVSRTRAINMFADTCGVSDNTMQNYMKPGERS